MNSQRDLSQVGPMLVRYSAEQMPVKAIIDIQHQTVTDLRDGEIKPSDALRILNLLLTISIQKLTAVPS